MNIVPNIRQHYTPVQPTVKEVGQNVAYAELSPEIVLQPFIHCYWELKTKERLTEQFTYKVVADGCIDIYFELNNAAENYVMGFCRQYTEFPLGHSFHYIGIRFLPTMFSQIFNVNAAELSDRFERLDLISLSTSEFISDHIANDHSFFQIKNILDSYFVNRLSGATLNFDNRLYKAITLILRNSGALIIEKDLDIGISSRQLRRLFDFYIGDTPKTFSKVVRFQRILSAKPSRQSLREMKYFFDWGYYDQTHFIKEFKTFYGITPTMAFDE